jgi:hypothetical protein
MESQQLTTGNNFITSCPNTSMQQSYFLFGRSPVQVTARRIPIQWGSFATFLNTGNVKQQPKLGIRLIPSSSFPTHNSVIILPLNAVWFQLWLTLFNKWINRLNFNNLIAYGGGEVKCTLVQALSLCTGHTAHWGSTGIALLFHDQRQ